MTWSNVFLRTPITKMKLNHSPVIPLVFVQKFMTAELEGLKEKKEPGIMVMIKEKNLFAPKIRASELKNLIHQE